MSSIVYKPKHDDIVDYGRYGHCKDGIAVVKWDNRNKTHYYRDTYWYSGGSDSNVYPNAEDVKLLFSLKDVREVREWEYERYDQGERYVLNSEHGYRKSYYVKKSAKPSVKQQLDNAYKEQREAREAIDSAIWSYNRATEKVTKLEIERDAAKTPSTKSLDREGK